MNLIRRWGDIDQSSLTPAEAALIAACQTGEKCVLGDGKPPEEDAEDTRQINAPLLRYLILGGCPDFRVAGRGIRLTGALVLGRLDLSFQMAQGTTNLANCRFPQRIDAWQTHLHTLLLDGSHISALNAQGARIAGDVFLREIEATGEISLAGATIGGQLDCSGARFSASGADALNAQKIRVDGGLFWRDGTSVKSGGVDFTAGHLSDLADDLSRWKGIDRLRLDGLTYEYIYGELTVKARLEWLASGSYIDGAFRPQPYTQLAKTYRDMGRDGDARKVLRERERREHADLRRRVRARANGPLDKAGAEIFCGLRWMWEQVLRWGMGYGYSPQRAFYALVSVWLIAVALSHLAWSEGDFAPNSGPVQMSPEWQAVIACETDCATNPAEVWGARTQPGQDWETFNRYAYAADLVIPVINFGQTQAWTPSTNRGPWGQRLWRYGFLLNIAGWLITALGAAAITGLVRRD